MPYGPRFGHGLKFGRPWGARPMARRRPRNYPWRMSKPLALAILIVGVVLLLFGLNAGDSIASETKEAFTGTPTDKSMALTVVGIIAIIVGGASALLRRPR